MQRRHEDDRTKTKEIKGSEPAGEASRPAKEIGDFNIRRLRNTHKVIALVSVCRQSRFRTSGRELLAVRRPAWMDGFPLDHSGERPVKKVSRSGNRLCLRHRRPDREKRQNRRCCCLIWGCCGLGFLVSSDRRTREENCAMALVDLSFAR